MAHVATALFRTGTSWSAADVDLTDAEDLDGVADLLRTEGEAAAVRLLMLDEDDEYLVLVRADGEDEARIFISDRRVLDGTSTAARLFIDALPLDEVPAVAAEDDDDEDDSAKPEAEPAGDNALLADLGVTGADLLGWCAEEGMLPADVLFAAAEKMGCDDVLAEVRGVA